MKKVEWNKEFPISGYDRETSSFQLADGDYLQMYQIISKDLINSDADEIEMDCFQWAKFYKTYWRDMEIVSMMFHVTHQNNRSIGKNGYDRIRIRSLQIC